MYENVDATLGTSYRVTYQITANSSPTTNTVALVFGGASYGTSNTQVGTYTETLPLLTTNTIGFAGSATSAGTLSIDNVTFRLAPDPAFAEQVIFSVGTTGVPVYVNWDCDSTHFTNLYATSHSILVDSNRSVNIERGFQSAPIHKIWY